MEWPLFAPDTIKVVFMGLAVVFTVAGAYSLHAASRAEDRWRRRIRGRVWQDEGSTVSRWLAEGRAGRAQLLAALGGVIQPRSDRDKSRTRRQLLNAGFRESSLLPYFGVRLCAMVLLASLAFSWLTWLGAPDSQVLLALLVGSAGIGYYLPAFGLWVIGRRRINQFEAGFPDAVDLLVICVESGLSTDAAMQRVAEELIVAFPVLSHELQRVIAGVRSGQTRQDALNQLYDRVGLDDLRQFTSVIVQSETLGGSISQALRAESDSIRDRRRFEAEEKAAKLPVKLMFPVVLFIFPVLLVVLLFPAVIQLLKVLSSVNAP